MAEEQEVVWFKKGTPKICACKQNYAEIIFVQLGCMYMKQKW